MGVWGVGIHQNDDSMDLESTLNELISKGYSLEEAFNLIPHDRYCSMVLKYIEGTLAFADLQIEKMGKLNEYAKGTVEKTLEYALSDEVLNDLHESLIEPRKEELLRFKEKLQSYID